MAASDKPSNSLSCDQREHCFHAEKPYNQPEVQTQTNVASVRSLYEGLASSPTAFVSELNEVLFRLMNSQLWEGCTEDVLFPLSDDGYIVLPRQYISVLGYSFNGFALPVWDQFHEYQPLGIGWQDVDEMCCAGLLDTGKVVTQVEYDGTFTLRVKITSASDAGKTIRFYGKDQNGDRIYTTTTGIDGINFTTVSPSADTTQQFTSVTGIQCEPDLMGRWTLWAVVSGVETQIGEYEPGESIPAFRRYKIGIRDADDVIRCFCRRQFVRVTAETDWVFPGCLSAIKMGFKALQLENANKYDPAAPNADDQWERAESELDKELGVLRGGSLPSLKMIGGPYPMCQMTVN